MTEIILVEQPTPTNGISPLNLISDGSTSIKGFLVTTMSAGRALNSMSA